MFSIFKLIPFKTKKIPLNILEKKILEVSSFKKEKVPYHINKNENSLKNKVYSLDFNDITKFGLNKFKSFLYFVIDTINNTKKLKLSDIKKIIKYNLLLDYIQINLARLYT